MLPYTIHFIAKYKLASKCNPMKTDGCDLPQITSYYPRRHQNAMLIISLLKVSIISFPTKADLCELKE